MDKHQHHQYVIVGGGISGLQAALILAEHGKDFAILQAQERVGGRICSLTVGEAVKDRIGKQSVWLEKFQNRPVDCGATWICEDHSFMRYFCKLFQCKLINQNYKGKPIFAQSPHKYQQLNHRGQHFSSHKQKIRDLIETLQKISQQLSELEQRQQQNLLTEEQKNRLSELYSQYDNQSAFDFVSSHLQDTFLAQLLAKEMCSLEGGSPHKFSVITLMGDSIEPLADVQCYVGLKESVVDGYRMNDGMSSIYKKFYEAIQSTLSKSNKIIKDYVKLNIVVKQIKHKNTPVEIYTEDGRVFTANKVIISLPIATFHKIKCDNLSEGKRMLLGSQMNCKIVRMTLFFKTPFWRPKYSGYASFSPQFAMNELIDVSPDTEQYGVLLFAFADDGFERWTKEIDSICSSKKDTAEYKIQFYEKNKEKILLIVANLFLEGDYNHRDLDNVAIFWKTLSDSPYIQATYQSLTSISLIDKINKKGLSFNSIWRNEENMIVIGSDFSEQFNGYMEGGIRIARKKIHKQLQIPDPIAYLFQPTVEQAQKS